MNEDKLRNYTNTTYDGIITIYSHDIKPNWLRFDTQSLWDHPTSAKLQVAKTRVGVTGVGPVSTRAPTGRGQIWTRARICPPALEVETYVPGAEVILSQNNSGHELLPSNNIGRILIAYFFFFWPFLPENSLTLWQKCFTFFAWLWVVWAWQVTCTCFFAQDVDSDDSCFWFTTSDSVFCLFS